MDQFGHKRFQKNCKDVDYKLLKECLKNILLYVSGRLSKNRSVHTYDIPRTVYFDSICIWIQSVPEDECHDMSRQLVGDFFRTWKMLHSPQEG